MRLAWTDRALERVRETARYIAADDPAAALRWASGLFDAVERLADYPESGRLAPELEGRSVREFVFGAYRVFYRVDEAVVLILTVRHASQLIREDEVAEGRT
ncbi:MAG TPA: type II toxin-antitoxin system RelE/ParE family toxin [Thermoleophilia bacterium]